MNSTTYHVSFELFILLFEPFEIHLKFHVLARYHIYGFNESRLLRSLLTYQVLETFLVDTEVDPQVFALLLAQK